MKYDHIHIGIGNAHTGVGTHIFDVPPRSSATIPLGDGTELVVERRVKSKPAGEKHRWCHSCRRGFDVPVCEHVLCRRRDYDAAQLEVKTYQAGMTVYHCPWWQSGEVK